MKDYLISLFLGFGLLAAAAFAAATTRHSRTVISLIATAIFSISALTVILATYQVRMRIASFALPNDHISAWRLNRMENERLDKIKNNETRISKIKKQKEKQDEIVDDKKPTLLTALANLDKSPNAKQSLLDHVARRGTGNNSLKELQEKIAEIDSTHEADKNNATRTIQAIRAANSEALRLDTEIRDLRSVTPETLFPHKAGSQISATEREKALDIAEEINALRSISMLGARPFHYSLHAPHELLLIMIVMFAGMLGRCIELVLAGAQKSNYYDPLLGAVVGLVLYVVVKAGVIIAVDPRSSGMSTDLNPFLVAFMGLVAGLRTDNVMARVRATADSWLKLPTGGTPRYGIALASLMQAAGRTRDQWLKQYPADEAEFNMWIEGRKPVPEERQAAMALWLGKSASEIFSDLPPPQAQPAAETNGPEAKDTKAGTEEKPQT